MEFISNVHKKRHRSIGTVSFIKICGVLEFYLSVQIDNFRLVKHLAQLRNDALEVLGRIVRINRRLILPVLDEAVNALIRDALVGCVRDVALLCLRLCNQLAGQLAIFRNAFFLDDLSCRNLNHKYILLVVSREFLVPLALYRI